MEWEGCGRESLANVENWEKRNGKKKISWEGAVAVSGKDELAKEQAASGEEQVQLNIDHPW